MNFVWIFIGLGLRAVSHQPHFLGMPWKNRVRPGDERQGQCWMKSAKQVTDGPNAPLAKKPPTGSPIEQVRSYRRINFTRRLSSKWIVLILAKQKLSGNVTTPSLHSFAGPLSLPINAFPQGERIKARLKFVNQNVSKRTEWNWTASPHESSSIFKSF
jgi:hypothetical protein